MICRNGRNCFHNVLNDNKPIDCRQKRCCIEFCDNRSDARCSENGKTYHLLNKDRKYKILLSHVDGGLVITDKDTPDNTAKCDYLYLVDVKNENAAVLVELKGRDLYKAIDQIDNTMRLLSDVLSDCGCVYGRIVYGGGVPNMRNNPKYMKLQRRIMKNGGNLRAEEKMSDDIEDLIRR